MTTTPTDRKEVAGGHSKLRIRTAVATLVAVFLTAGSHVSAQDEPSLGDVARQTRKERTLGKQQVSTPAASEASRLTAELEQEQEETGAPPAGFQSYSAEGYSVSVPAPFSVEGRDDNGILLATAAITGVTTKVFAATPIHISAHPSDLEFNALAQGFWRPYGSLSCEKSKPGAPDHHCFLGGTLLQYQFTGEARFIEDDNRIVPVVCFSTVLPSEDVDFSQAYTGDQRAQMSDRALRNMDRRSMATYSSRLCKTVLGSIRLKVGPVQLHVTNARVQAAKVLMTSEGGTGEGPSLGNLARETRREAAQGARSKISVESEDTINAAPPGFRVHSGDRCSRECWQETFFLPENARRVKGGNSENVYVAMLDDTTSVVIYFGTADVYGSSEFAKAQAVARRWIHAERDPRAKEIHIRRTINGREVAIVRSGLIANMNAWIEEEAGVGAEGLNLSIGCIAREDRFADAESICSTIYESWRLHR